MIIKEEPWVPESIKRRLVIGARVRIRPSLECRVVGKPQSAHARAGLVGHEPEEFGAVGTIIASHQKGGLQEEGHPYTVEFDEAVYFTRCDQWSSTTESSAAELIPLEEGEEE